MKKLLFRIALAAGVVAAVVVIRQIVQDLSESEEHWHVLDEDEETRVSEAPGETAEKQNPLPGE